MPPTGSVEGASGGGSPSFGTLEDMLIKSPDTDISLHGGPFPSRGEPGMLWGTHILGTLIDEWRRALEVGHLSARNSTKGTLMEGSFTGEPEKWGFWEICKMPCKRASLSIGALLRNLEGVRLPGLLREKKSISGFLSLTQRPLGFWVWGHLEL